MLNKNSFIDLIAENVIKVQNQEISFEELYCSETESKGKNEFLFFIKPELLIKSPSIDIKSILDLIHSKIEENGFDILNIKILSANYLDKYNIIAQHYGVINKIASDAINNISEGAKEKFAEYTGNSINDVQVLGGLQFLEKYPYFNAYSLDYLWQNIENKKLAGGTYYESIKVDGETTYVINGFHPRQLKHFTEAGRSIVVMTLSGDVSWKDARNNFIGATNPSNANKGSLRKEILDNKDKFGLAEVSQGVNGVHLSAGPVEALVELRRYNSNFSDINTTKSFTDFSFGKKLSLTFGERMDDIVNNINVDVNGKSTSIFDLTEEMDSDESIEVIKKYIIT